VRTISVWLLAVCLRASAQEPTPEALIEAGHWKRARDLVERRLREAPDDPNAVFLSSQVRNAFGDHNSPFGLAERAVRLDGSVARYHRQLAEAAGVMAQHANPFQQLILAHRFRKEIDVAIMLDPGDTQARRDLVEYYLLAPGIAGGDVKKAELAARQLEAIDECAAALAKARIAEFRKDPAQQEAFLKSAAAARPPRYKAFMALAEFYMTRGGQSAAETVAQNALAIDPTRVGAYCVLAVIYAGRADWAALDELLSKAEQSVPDDLAPYYSAGERLLADGRDPARAVRYFRMYLSREPEGNQPSLDTARSKLALARGR